MANLIGFKRIPGIPGYLYDNTQELGRGSTSRVYKARRVATPERELAVKVMTTQETLVKRLLEVKVEWTKELLTAKRMAELTQSVNVYETSIERKSGYIVMDAGTRSLKQFSELLTDRPSEKEIVYLAYHLLAVVRELKSQNIFHNDLHPGNILLTDVCDKFPENRSEQVQGLCHRLRQCRPSGSRNW